MSGHDDAVSPSWIKTPPRGPDARGSPYASSALWLSGCVLFTVLEIYSYLDGYRSAETAVALLTIATLLGVLGLFQLYSASLLYPLAVGVESRSVLLRTTIGVRRIPWSDVEVYHETPGPGATETPANIRMRITNSRLRIGFALAFSVISREQAELILASPQYSPREPNLPPAALEELRRRRANQGSSPPVPGTIAQERRRV
jgi:hypothetical protein